MVAEDQAVADRHSQAQRLELTPLGARLQRVAKAGGVVVIDKQRYGPAALVLE